MTEAISLAGVILAAVLAYVFEARWARRSRLHAEQIDATTAFCRALMDYRGAQIMRWHLGEADSDEVSAARDQVRLVRASAWAAYLHVVLVIDDAEAAGRCRQALDSATDLRRRSYASAEALDRAGDEVRRLAELFVVRVAKVIGVQTATLGQPTSTPSH